MPAGPSALPAVRAFGAGRHDAEDDAAVGHGARPGSAGGRPRSRAVRTFGASMASRRRRGVVSSGSAAASARVMKTAAAIIVDSAVAASIVSSTESLRADVHATREYAARGMNLSPAAAM